MRGDANAGCAAWSSIGILLLWPLTGALAQDRAPNPLMQAATDCDLDTIQRLLAHHADVNVTDRFRLTPLDYAAPYCDAGVMRALLDAGADPNARDIRGMTPLMWAVASDSADAAVVRVLIHGGADVTAKSKSGETALDWARKFGNKDVLSQLTAAGAWEPEAPAPVEQRRARPREIAAAVARALDRRPAPALPDSVPAASSQYADGHWHAPFQESDIVRTAWAIHGLRQSTEFAARMAKARNWLAKAIAVNSEDAAMQIAGLAWAGAPSAQVNALAQGLIAAQRPDGGWAPNPNLASDALATGETLWALRETGVLQVDDAAYRRGVEYLLRTQSDDGSWHVRSRRPTFEAASDDRGNSIAATRWAVLALMPAIPKETTR